MMFSTSHLNFLHFKRCSHGSFESGTRTKSSHSNLQQSPSFFTKKHQSTGPPWWENRLYLMYYKGFRAELIVYSWDILGTHVGNTCWDSGNSREHTCRLTTTVVSLYGSGQILKARVAQPCTAPDSSCRQNSLLGTMVETSSAPVCYTLNI